MEGDCVHFSLMSSSGSKRSPSQERVMSETANKEKRCRRKEEVATGGRSNEAPLAMIARVDQDCDKARETPAFGLLRTTVD